MDWHLGPPTMPVQERSDHLLPPSLSWEGAPGRRSIAGGARGARRACRENAVRSTMPASRQQEEEEEGAGGGGGRREDEVGGGAGRRRKRRRTTTREEEDDDFFLS